MTAHLLRFGGLAFLRVEARVDDPVQIDVEVVTPFDAAVFYDLWVPV